MTNTVLHALRKAEEFIAGFEDDPMQEGIPEMLANIRTAIEVATAFPQALDALCTALPYVEAEVDSPAYKKNAVSKDQHQIRQAIDAIALGSGKLVTIIKTASVGKTDQFLNTIGREPDDA